MSSPSEKLMPKCPINYSCCVTPEFSYTHLDIQLFLATSSS